MFPSSGTSNFFDRDSKVLSFKITSSPCRDVIAPIKREEPHLIGFVFHLKWAGSRVIRSLFGTEPLALVDLTVNWTMRWKIGAICSLVILLIAPKEMRPLSGISRVEFSRTLLPLCPLNVINFGWDPGRSVEVLE